MIRRLLIRSWYWMERKYEHSAWFAYSYIFVAAFIAFPIGAILGIKEQFNDLRDAYMDVRERGKR